MKNVLYIILMFWNNSKKNIKPIKLLGIVVYKHNGDL